MKILLPVDGSEISGYTIDWACRFMNRDSHRIYLITIINDPMIAEYKVEDAIATLQKARLELEGCGIPVEKTEYVTHAHPVEAICQYAEEEGIDQVLMGSHGRTGLAKVMLGSVSQGVLERCKKPVFIYRHGLSQLAEASANRGTPSR